MIHSFVLEAEVGPDAKVGPFAYLRPGTMVGEGAKVGTFVEVKNSDIGAGAKVPHLSYLGDADVGEGSNLGASTITANYDGRKKHRTKIGKSVKTGIHTSLVAPLDVGDRAYTGAGSTITRTSRRARWGSRARNRRTSRVTRIAWRRTRRNEQAPRDGRGAGAGAEHRGRATRSG